MIRKYVGLWLFFVVASFALAQTNQTGAISGKVTDKDGSPLPGAVVNGSQADGSYPTSAVTNAEGFYRLGLLRPGKYQVTVSLTGFATSRREGIAVSATETASVNFQLKLSQMDEVLVVGAELPLIDKGTTEYSTSLSAEDTKILPITRTATDLLEFTPGARPNQLWGGSTDQANSYQLDGVGVNSPGFGGSFLLPNVSWIQDFQVKGLGAGAEYGNFQGGLVNIVTKSGSNTFQGAVNMVYENSSLNDSNLVVGEAGTEVDSFTEFNADIGGAFISDKLYYFFSAERQRRELNVVDLDASDLSFLDTREEREETKLFGKLTYQATENDTLNLVLSHDDVETEFRGLSSTTRPEATTTQESPATLYNLAWERKLGGGAHILEVKFTGYVAENNLVPQNGDSRGVIQLGGRREAGRNAAYTRTRDLDSNSLTVNLDSYLLFGSTTHHLKVGAETSKGGWEERRRRNGGFTWRPRAGENFDLNDPSTWDLISSDWGGDIDLYADSTNSAAFVQDYISLNDHVDLSVGLRYGAWKGELLPGDGSGPRFTALDDSALAPRIGLTYDIKGDSSWVMKAHWGRYYQNMFALLFDRVEGANAFADEEYWDWIGDGLPDLDGNYNVDNIEDYFAFDDSTPTSELTGPVENYSQPHVDQLVLGIEHQLNNDWKVGVTWFSRENKDILALLDKNMDTNYTAFHDVQVWDYNTGDPVTGSDGNPLVLPTLWVANDDILYLGEAPGMTAEQIDGLSWNPEYVLTNAEDAERKMEQFQFKAERNGDVWSTTLSVTHSDLKGNFFSVSGYDDPSGSGAGPYVHRNEQINFYGDLRNYSEWEAKLRLSARLPMDFNLGTFIRWDSGDYYTPTYNIDRRNHDFYANNGEDYLDPDLLFFIGGENVLLEERGSRTYDDFMRIDLHLDKEFDLGKSSSLVFGFDIFNLLNDDAATSLNTSVNDQDPDDPSTLFGAVRARQAPRQIRFFSSLRF